MPLRASYQWRSLLHPRTRLKPQRLTPQPGLPNPKTLTQKQIMNKGFPATERNYFFSVTQRGGPVINSASVAFENESVMLLRFDLATKYVEPWVLLVDDEEGFAEIAFMHSERSLSLAQAKTGEEKASEDEADPSHTILRFWHPRFKGENHFAIEGASSYSVDVAFYPSSHTNNAFAVSGDVALDNLPKSSEVEGF